MVMVTVTAWSATCATKSAIDYATTQSAVLVALVFALQCGSFGVPMSPHYFIPGHKHSVVVCLVIATMACIASVADSERSQE